MPKYDWWVYIVLASPGIFLYVMNWLIVFHNARGGKWVSNVPGLGGLWIAIVCLLSPVKWMALLGLTDPGVWLIFVAIFQGVFSRKGSSDEIQESSTQTKDPEDLQDKNETTE